MVVTSSPPRTYRVVPRLIIPFILTMSTLSQYSLAFPRTHLSSFNYFNQRSHLRKLANPAPLGLFSFASTTLILSMINVQTRGVVEVRYFFSAACQACAYLPTLSN